MSTRGTPSAALPILYVMLRFLVVFNWLSGAGILVLLTAMPTRRWIITSLHLTPSPDADWVVTGLRAIVRTVRSGDPFVSANAQRLQAIAWTLLALQLLSLVVGAIARSVSAIAPPVHIDAGFSIAGWLAVLLTFLLARVFAEGTL